MDNFRLISFADEATFAAALVLLLCVALWIAWLERALIKSRESQEVLAEALHRVAVGEATVSQRVMTWFHSLS